MEWDTGKTLAVIILLLIVAAIAWFMVRAGRKRAAARYAEAERERTGTASAVVAGTPSSPPGVATSTSGSAASVRHDRDGINNDRHDGPAGTERFEPVGSEREAPAAAALTEARASRIGVSAEPASPGGDGGEADTVTHRRPDGADAAAPGAFSAPDVPLHATDGNLRSQGGGADAPDVVASAGSAGDSGATGGAPPLRSDALTGARASRLGVDAEPGAPEIGVPATGAAETGERGTDERGTDEPGPGGHRAPDGPAAFSAPNVPLRETDGNLRSQGGGADAPDVVERGAGDGGRDGSGAVSTAAKVAAGVAGVAAVAATAAAVAAGRRRDDGSPSAGESPTDAPSPAPGDAPVAFSAPNVELRETGGELRSQGSGPDVADVAPGRPGDPGRPDGPGLAADGRRAFDPANDGHPSPADADASFAGTRVGSTGGGGDPLDRLTDADAGVRDDGRRRFDPAIDGHPLPAPDGAVSRSGSGDGTDTAGGATARAGTDAAAGDPTGDEVGGVSAARVHPADGDGLQGAGESVPLVHKGTDADPAAPVPAGDVAIRDAGGEPPAINTTAGADVAAAGPTDERPDDERANLPDPAVAGGLDGLRPPPSTGRSMHRTTSGLPDARPALEGDFAVRSGDAAHDACEMIKILNLRESDAARLELSADEYRGLREGRADAVPGDRLERLVSRLAGMMV